ncbi:MAG TPA: septal ring lytic transglycosylase RlpA family protein [Candidatus Eisenbacteria bacterium]|jgi:rare lipoprotein A
MRRVPFHVWLPVLLLAAGCAATRPLGGAAPFPAEVGIASYYTEREQGGRTASGTRYDDRALTAAHRTLPFGTRVRVTNLANGRSTVLTITDRGPFRKGRVIDVSRRAAERLGFRREGTARVRVEVLPG